MKKRLQLYPLLAFALLSCGVSEDAGMNLNIPQKETSSSQKTNNAETSLALSSSAGNKYASDLSGQKSLMAKAFRSFVNYTNVLGGRCSGVLAYDDVVNGSATVYFYTASHCFEERTPLGDRRAAERALQVVVSNPKSYLGPEWLAANAVARKIKTVNAQIFRHDDGKLSDIVRIPQYQGPLTDIGGPLDPVAGKVLPLCHNSQINGHQAVGFTHPRNAKQGVVWADLSSETSPPANFLKLLKLATNTASFRVARGVNASSGDSGTPVYGVLRPASMVGVDKYQYLHGLITREVWTKRSCSTGFCTMNGEAVFERVRNSAGTNAMSGINSIGGRWVWYVGSE